MSKTDTILGTQLSNTMLSKLSFLEYWLEYPLFDTDSNYNDLYLEQDNLEYLPQNCGLELRELYDVSENTTDPDVLFNPNDYIEWFDSYIKDNEDCWQYSRDKEEDPDKKLFMTLLKCYEKYANISIIIPPSINRGPANYLFKKLVLRQKESMRVQLPEICYTNSGTKYSVSTNQQQIIGPKEKIAFYNFCLNNSFTFEARNFFLRDFQNVSRPPIVTKKILGKMEVQKNIINTLATRKRIQEGNLTKPYAALTHIDATKLLMEVSKELEKYYENINILWDEIMAPYVSYSNYNKSILHKIDDSSLGRNEFFNFCFSLTIYKSLQNTSSKLAITVTHLEQIIEENKRKELLKEQSKQTKVVLIDKSKLVGMSF